MNGEFQTCWFPEVTSKTLLRAMDAIIIFKYGVTTITYLPHEAKTEDSKDKKPIGMMYEIQLMSDSTGLKFKSIEFQFISDLNDLSFNGFQT